MEPRKLTTKMRMLGALSSALGRLPASARTLIETTKTAVVAAQKQAAAPKPYKLNRKQRRVQRALQQIAARHSQGWRRPQ
jgi:hypothetical protein